MTDTYRRPERFDDPVEAVEPNQSPSSEQPYRKPGRVDESVVPMEEDTSGLTKVVLNKRSTLPLGRWLLGVLVLLLLLWLGLSAYTFLHELARTQRWLAIPIAILITAGFVLGIWIVLREWRANRVLGGLKTQQVAIDEAIRTNDMASYQALVNPRLQQISIEHPEWVSQLRIATAGVDNLRDYQNYLEDMLLRKLDARADLQINQAVITVGTAVIIIPHPALDALVVIWRASVMVRQVARIYGIYTTVLSSWVLLRHVVVDALLAIGLQEGGQALAQLGTDSAIDGSLSKVAEGAVLAMRMKRLGNITKKCCRPLTN